MLAQVVLDRQRAVPLQHQGEGDQELLAERRDAHRHIGRVCPLGFDIGETVATPQDDPVFAQDADRQPGPIGTVERAHDARDPRLN